MQLDGLRVDLDHLDEGLDRLVGLLVQQEVEPLEIGARQRARLGDDLLDVDARGDPAQAEEQREAQQPPVFELHRQSGGTGGGGAASAPGGGRFSAEISRRWRTTLGTTARMPNSAPSAKA